MIKLNFNQKIGIHLKETIESSLMVSAKVGLEIAWRSKTKNSWYTRVEENKANV